jgi:hypothetical protein
MLREAFIEWAKYIKTKQNKNGEPLFIGVVAGSGYADVTFPDNVLQKRINHQEEFGARANIYTDLSEIGNYKLAFNLKRRYIGGEKKYV